MLDLETILIIISETLCVPINQIKLRNQTHDVVDARSLYVHFSSLNNFTYSQLVELINISAPTASYHIKRVRELVATDEDMRKKYAKCSGRIKSYKEQRLEQLEDDK